MLVFTTLWSYSPLCPEIQLSLIKYEHKNDPYFTVESGRYLPYRTVVARADWCRHLRCIGEEKAVRRRPYHTLDAYTAKTGPRHAPKPTPRSSSDFPNHCHFCPKKYGPFGYGNEDQNRPQIFGQSAKCQRGAWLGERGAQGGRVFDIIHGRSRITVDPRIPTMPGRSTSGFHRPGAKIGLHQARQPSDVLSPLHCWCCQRGRTLPSAAVSAPGLASAPPLLAPAVSCRSPACATAQRNRLHVGTYVNTHIMPTRHPRTHAHPQPVRCGIFLISISCF